MNTKFQVISPVDGSVYAERSLASAKEIDKVLAVAEKAQRGWKTSSINERAAVCRKAVQYFLEQAGEMAEELSWQMGRPIRYTPFEISKGFQERAHYMIDIAEGALADIHPQAQAGFRRFIRREPLGTALVLAPWNYPYLTSVNVVIPAIMAGNAVILKHAQQTLVDKQYRDYFKEHQMQLDGTRVVLTYKFIKLSDNATDGETERAASQLKAAITEGDLGERVTTEFAGKLPRPVTAEAFSINIGETSDIIFTPQAAYVIRVHERIPGQLSLEDVRTQVLSVLAQQLWDEEVARQRSNARIRVTLP